MEIASLGLGVKNDQVDKATQSLTAFTTSASAADKAAQKMVAANDAAGKSSEEFSRRVKRNIEALEFQAAQMTRSSAEQERYNALRRAGVTSESAAGQAVSKNIQLIQQQRAAQQQATEAARQATEAARAAQQTATESARIAQQRIDSTNKIIADLEHERAQLARTSTEQAQYNAIRRAGVSASSTEGKAIMATVAALETEREALRQLQMARLAATKAGPVSGGLTGQQKMILGYQLNDIFTSAIGGMNPAMIAAQQGPQITQIFGGLRNTIAAIPKPLLIGGGATVGAAIAASVLHDLAAMNDTLQEQQRRFTTLLGSQTEAARAYRDIAGFASDAGIGMAAATEKFVAFARAGQALGATRQNVADIASTTEKLSQLSGASPAEGTAAQGALADMLKDSTVNADQLKTVLGNVPQIADRIAAGLGVSVTQLRLMAAEGELSNRQVFDALLKQTAAVNAEFARMPKSVGATFTSLADDMGQVLIRFANLIPLVQQYRLAIDLAAKGAKALNDATTPATPEQRLGTANDRINGADRLRTGNVRLGSNRYARDVLEAQFDQAVNDNQATFSAIAAQSSAAKEAVVNTAAIAEKLDPLARQFRESRKETDDLQKAIDYLQSGLSGLSTSEAAAQVDRLTTALDRARKAAAAIDPALKALEDVRLRGADQAQYGSNPGQSAYGARVRELSGGDPAREQNAIMAAQEEQQEALNKLVKSKQDELAIEEKITAATGKSRQAMIEAQVAAEKLKFEMQHVGIATDASAKAAQEYADNVRKILEQQLLQQQIVAAKSLKDEYDGIVAAQQALIDGQGAFAQRRAQAQVRAERDPMGTGQQQMEVFDQQQWFADAVMLDSLRKQVDLTNKLAAAAGNVAAQKKIQLEFDIKRAQENAHPGSAAEIDKQMRGKAAADSDLAYQTILAQSREFVAAQEIEQQAIFLSAEAAAQLRLEHQMLTQARQAGIDLTPAQIEAIRQASTEMAAASERVRRQKEIFDFAKQTATSFFQDIGQGLREGKSLWDSLGNAAMNALNRIADKLIQMAAEKLFESAFGGAGGAGGGGGGLGGMIGGGISNILGGGSWGSAAAGVGSTVPDFIGAGGAAFAEGGNYLAGRPRIVGERGWELDIPRTSGTIMNQRQIAAALGGGGSSPRIVIEVAADSEWVRATARNESGQVVAQSAPAIVDKAVEKSAKLAPRAVKRDKQMRNTDWRLG